MLLKMPKTIHCLIIDDEPTAREILENHLQKIDAVKIAGSCKNAIDAFNKINSENVDLIFLDINMPEISGLSFAKSINPNIKVVFTTAYREYAIEGFDLQAVDYLLKPISFDRLLQAINKYFNENVVVTSKPDSIIPEKNDYFFVRSDRKMIKINFDEITYIESLSDYIKIHLNDETIITRESISNIEARLPQQNFMRTHRSFIISLKAIHSFTKETIGIDDHEIPISRSYKDKVLKRLDNN